MVSGVVGYTVRVMNSFSSRSFSSLASTLGEMPFISFRSSLNLRGDCVRQSISGIFHLPFSTYIASRIFRIEPVHASFETRTSSSSVFIAVKIRTSLKVTASLQVTAGFCMGAARSFVVKSGVTTPPLTRYFMKRILHISSSILGDASYSIKLAEEIITKIQEKYPGSTVELLDLARQEVPHLSPQSLGKLFAPANTLSEDDARSVQFANDLIQQLMAADIIVIGAPLYNFSIPSTLKAWIDHVTRAGVTFGYGEDGRPVGLVMGKKVYIAMASGGIYSEGPMKAYDFAAPFLQALLGFLGMTDVTVFRAEGVKIPGIQEHALEKAVASIQID
jgi:FMN-dependent NADH-azoreductase